jgi:DNA-binding transcriptional LysR family regulator
MNAALDAICAFIIAQLPDSIRERKRLLAAMVLVLPKSHPLRARVKALHLLLESHEQHQLNLALDFQKEKPSNKADGDGDGESVK